MGKIPQKTNFTEMWKAPLTKNKTRHDSSVHQFFGNISIEALPAPMGFQEQ
jgi:hypothetical protein